MIGGLPLLGLIVLLTLFIMGQLGIERLAGDFNRINVARFNEKAQALSTALIPYARDMAGTILFWGSLAVIPLKFIKQLGLFIVPLLFLFQVSSIRQVLSKAPLFAWAFLAHFFVLSTFVIDMQFLAGRYVAVLGLLAAPFVGLGFLQLLNRFPHWKNVLLLLSFLIMASNVIPLTPRQTYFVQAGEWLARNASENPRNYIESSRTAYYAGWRAARLNAPDERLSLPATINLEKYDLFVLEVSRRETDIDSWLENNGLRVAQRFKNSREDSIIIATHKSTP